MIAVAIWSMPLADLDQFIDDTAQTWSTMWPKCPFPHASKFVWGILDYAARVMYIREYLDQEGKFPDVYPEPLSCGHVIYGTDSDIDSGLRKHTEYCEFYADEEEEFD